MRVTCEVTAVKDGGLEVKLIDDDVTTFIRRSDLAATAPSSGPSASASARSSTPW